jgi:hypothetical protein
MFNPLPTDHLSLPHEKLFAALKDVSENEDIFR